MIEYILLVTTVTFLTIYAYIKLSFPFWNNQPVFHSYDYWRFFYYTPFFIYKYRPMKTKFCEFQQIKTLEFADVTSQQKKDICQLLQSNYIQNDRILFTLTLGDLDAHYTGQNEPSFLSIYSEKTYEFSNVINANEINANEINANAINDNEINDNDKNNTVDPSFSKQYENVITILQPIGTTISKAQKLYYRETQDQNIYTELQIYNIDMICAKRTADQKKINRQLLQTHEYNQRTKNPVIICSLIKKEIDLFEGVIPLTEYLTYVFYLRNVTFNALPPHFYMSQVDLEHIELITDFFYEQTHLDLAKTPKYFDIMVLSDMGNVIALIKQNLLFAYCLRNGAHIYGFYFFKDAKMQYEDIEGDTLQLVGSVMNCNDPALFYSGFLHAMHNIVKKQKTFKMLMFEAISDNAILLQLWREKNTPIFTNKTAYYTFNVIFPRSPMVAERCLVL